MTLAPPSKSSQNLPSSINEDGFSPWEIAKLEECEPEASGGHLAFAEERRQLEQALRRNKRILSVQKTEKGLTSWLETLEPFLQPATLSRLSV